MKQGILLVIVVGPLIATAEAAFVASLGSGAKQHQRWTNLAVSATTRRDSFGEILGSALLPVASAACGVPDIANAADDYPFKVCAHVHVQCASESLGWLHTHTDG